MGHDFEFKNTKINSKLLRVYLDYASTTPLDGEAAKAMQPFFSKQFGNSGSLHSFGAEAVIALAKARKIIADELRAKAGEVIFTSSASEANNWALKGTIWASHKKGKHVIVSAVEHASVLASAGWLKSQGFSVTILPVDKYGMVSVLELKKAIKPDTILVSIMYANNEVGTLNPISEIGRACKDRRILFHTDAAQAFGFLPIDVRRQNIDLLTASSHKIYGPKGVGCLYARNGVKIAPLIHGGGQEFGLRSSTANVSGAVGFAKAVEILRKKSKAERARLEQLRNLLIRGVLQKIDNVELGGHPNKRLPNNAHFIFSDILGEALVLELDKNGIAASTGSACLAFGSGSSQAVYACTKNAKKSRGALRFSLGKFTTTADIRRVLEILPGIVDKLRRLK